MCKNRYYVIGIIGYRSVSIFISWEQRFFILTIPSDHLYHVNCAEKLIYSSLIIMITVRSLYDREHYWESVMMQMSLRSNGQ